MFEVDVGVYEKFAKNISHFTQNSRLAACFMRRHGDDNVVARCVPFLAQFGLLRLLCGEI